MTRLKPLTLVVIIANLNHANSEFNSKYSDGNIFCLKDVVKFKVFLLLVWETNSSSMECYRNTVQNKMESMRFMIRGISRTSCLIHETQTLLNVSKTAFVKKPQNGFKAGLRQMKFHISILISTSQIKNHTSEVFGWYMVTSWLKRINDRFIMCNL